MPKKVLIIITKATVGGAQSSVLDLAKSLKKKGCDITVGFGYGSYLPGELKKAGINYLVFNRLKRTHNPFSSLFFSLELKNHLDENHYDTVHFNSSNSLAGAWGAKRSKTRPKTVFTFRGLSVLDPGYRKKIFFKWAYRLYFAVFMRYVDVPVFVSQRNYAQAMEVKLADFGIVIKNGLDKEKFAFLPRHEARMAICGFGIDPESFIIGSVGRLDYSKNYEFLISSFPEILRIRKNAVLIIFGEGPERKKYEGMIAARGLEKKIILAGEDPQARRIVKGFDLFVLPSRYEGMPITLLEILCAGIPALASEVGGNAEIFSDSDGQLYPPGNKAAFLEKFKTLSEDKKFREKTAAANLAISNDYDINKTAEKYLKIY